MRARRCGALLGSGSAVPIALAILITFVLSRPVMFLQRWIGVFLPFSSSSCSFSQDWGWLHGAQRPRYRTWPRIFPLSANIRQKISDVRGVSRGGSVEQVQQTVKEIQDQIAAASPSGNAGEPVIV